MKKLFFILSILTLTAIVARSQVTLQPNVPAVGLIQKNQLWSVLVINSSSNTLTDCTMNLILRDRLTGQEVLTASSGQFTISPGAKQLNINLLNPIQYNYLSGGLNNSFQGLIQVGTYTACYSLSGFSTHQINIAEDCVQFDAEPLSPPMLIFPADSSALETAPNQFTWTPPMPSGMFDKLNYEIVITEILDGQKADEALQQNIPFFSEGGLIDNLLNYPPSVSEFTKDKWFAWQVVAKDDREYAGKSEVWVFKVASSIVKAIIEQAPFIKMNKGVPEKGIAPNGILKLSYINETTDSIAEINIIDLSNQGKNDQRFTVVLKPGENLIEHNLRTFHLQEGKVYEVRIVNSRKEKWTMQFEIHQYQDKAGTDK